jgi:hypothetical protein
MTVASLTNQIVIPPEVVPGGIIETAAKISKYKLEDYVDYMCQWPTAVQYYDLAGQLTAYKSICPHTVSGGYGIVPSEVLVVSKMPNYEELDGPGNGPRMWSGVRGKMWKDYLDKWGVDYNSWLLSNVLWWHVDAKNTPARHLKECWHLTGQVINRAQPKYVLLWGAHALQQFCHVLQPKGGKLNFKDMRVLCWICPAALRPWPAQGQPRSSSTPRHQGL